MRILEVGCHDGYMALYVGSVLAEAGVPDLHIDCLEVNEEMAAIAAARLSTANIEGEVKVGVAEDAPTLFEVQSYDAVVCYEVIEHVLKVQPFLAALEYMTKPGGRIYLSTPDGTFGEGNNPNHLRVYRSIDLAEVLRRRGTIEDMQVGTDGITAATYTPKIREVKGDVAIYTGGGWEPWSPMDIEFKGLGGSETAAVRLAEALSDLGYTVTVYGEVEQGCYKQVVFRHHTTFDPLDERVALISSRIPEVYDRPVNAPSRLLWMHDTDCGPRLSPERAAHLTGVFVLSGWHLQHVLNIYPFLFREELVNVTVNGITPEYFGREERERQKRAIYSSSPDRGLDVILSVWPYVREQVPDAEFVFCYSSVYDAVAQTDPQLRAFRDRIIEMSDQPGVRSLGSLSQPELAAEMEQSKVWLAPSFNNNIGVPFYETYCIGAVESAAAGCFRVGANWGALAERNLDFPVDQLPNGEPNLAQLAEGIIEGLTTNVPGPRQWALENTWAQTAEDFDRVIQRDSRV